MRFEEHLPANEDGWGRPRLSTNGLGAFSSVYSPTNYTGVPDTVTSPGGVTTALTRHAANDGINALTLKSVVTSYVHPITQASVVGFAESYTYNLSGNLATWTSLDQQIGAPATTTRTFGYDAIDQLTESTLTSQPVATPPSKSQWAYDPMGNRVASMSRPNPSAPYNVQGAVFNQRNQLIQKDVSTNLPVEGTLSEPARVAVVKEAPGATTTIPNYQPAQPEVYNAKVYQAGSTWRFSKTLPFDYGANSFAVRAQDGSGNGVTNHFDYTLDSPDSGEYVYDDNGNLVWAFVYSGYDPISQAYSQATLLAHYTWDAENQLIGFEDTTHLTEWDYDGFGRRVAERNYARADYWAPWTLTETWRQWWEGTTLIQREKHASVNIWRYELYAEGELLDFTWFAGFYPELPLGKQLYVRDHLGSICGLFDLDIGGYNYGPRQLTTPCANSSYDAYDSAWSPRIPTASPPSTTYDNVDNSGLWGRTSGATEAGVSYTGHLAHPASGLLLAPFRAYDPRLGRWISEDPIQEAGGLNFYGYVGNGVTMGMDPLGFCMEDGLDEFDDAIANGAGILENLLGGAISGLGGGLEYSMYKFGVDLREGTYGFIDRSAGKGGGRIFHFDAPHPGYNYPHFNADIVPLKKKLNHSKISTSLAKWGTKSGLRTLGRGVAGLGIALDVYDIAKAGPCHTGRAVGGALVGWGGAVAGASIGTAIFPVVGTVIGAGIGGLLGSGLGQSVGAWLFD